MRSSLHLVCCSAALIAAIGWSGSALAQSAEGGSCEADADCAAGLLCEVVAMVGCTVPECAPDADCDPMPACETTEYRECVAPPCQADADCGAGLTCVIPSDGTLPYCQAMACVDDADCGDASLKCFTQKYEMCSGGAATQPACDPEGTCPEPVPVPPPTCETISESACAPLYVGECTESADCGPGFDCVAAEECTCSAPNPGTDAAEPAGSGVGGSTGTGSSPAAGTGTAGGSAGDPSLPAPDCTCTATGTLYCQLQVIDCVDASSCPAGWTCEGGATPDIACAPGATCPTVEPAPSPSQCSPPTWGGYYGDAADSGGSGEVSPIGDPRVPPEEEPAIGDDLGSAGAGPTAPGSDPEGSDPADSGDNDAAAESAEDDGGCQVAFGSPAGSSALGLLLGLVGLGALRRRR